MPPSVQGAVVVAGVRATPPRLVILADVDGRPGRRRQVLGCSLLDRLCASAREAGFDRGVLGPGTHGDDPELEALLDGDPIGAPALVVYEDVYIHPDLLRLMVEHPLDGDERYTLYDEVGRPAACFVGWLGALPAAMPVAEELPWPEPFGPADVVRMVYPEDRARVEALVLTVSETVEGRASWWRRTIDARVLRWLSRVHRPLPQLELLGLALALGSLPLVLLGGHLALWLGATSLLCGAYLSRLLPRLPRIRGVSDPADAASDGRLASASRPLGQAAFMGALTYVIVAQTHRSVVAAVVLLVAGGGAGLLSLARARTVLRGDAGDRFSLPSPAATARRLGLPWMVGLEGAPFVETCAWLASAVGNPQFPWSVLAAATAVRLWGWFSGPDDLFPRGSTSAAPRDDT